MSKLNCQNQNGESNGKQIMIIASITIVAALMIVAIFVILSKNKTNDAATDDFLKTIETQRKNQNPKNNTGASAESPTALSYTGVLMEIKTDSIIITEKESKNKITLFLTPETPVTYNGAPFSRSKFYIGDQLQITALNLGDKLQAEAVVVLVSASPATAAPVPPAANVRPDGSIKPL